jgi:amidase
MSLLQPVTRWLMQEGRKLSRTALPQLHDRLDAHVRSWFGDADLWLTPTVAERPPPIGAYAGLPPQETFARAAHLGAFTAPYNVTGQPAASIPFGLSSRGEPIGIQLAGRRGHDGTVLALAYQLEQARPWPHVWDRG